MTRTWLLGLLAMAAGSAAAAPAPPAAAAAAPGPWSPVVGGLHARLIATPTVDDAKRPQLRLELEIENTANSATPIPIEWGTMNEMLRLTLEDAGGHAVPDEGMGGSYASGPPFVVQLPVSSSLRTLISPAAYEYVPNGKTLLRPLTFQGFAIPSTHGPLFLRATFTPAAGGGLHAAPVVLAVPRIALP